MKSKTHSFEFYCTAPDCCKRTRIVLPIDDEGSPARAVRCSGCRKPLGHDWCPDCCVFHQRHEDIGQSMYCPLCGGTLEHGVGVVEESRSLRQWGFLVLIGATFLVLMTLPNLPILGNPPILLKFIAFNRTLSDQIIVAIRPFPLHFLLIMAAATTAYQIAINPPWWWMGLLYVLFTGRRSSAISLRGVTINPFYAAVVLTTRRRESTHNTIHLRRKALVVWRAVRCRFQRFAPVGTKG